MSLHNLVSQMNQWYNYHVESHQETVVLLRSICHKGVLLSMSMESDDIGTPIITMRDVDAENDFFIIDCPIDPEQKQRLIKEGRAAFETVVDKVRIMFSAEFYAEYTYNGSPALYFNFPQDLVRLQRREWYRVETPVCTPVLCTMTLPQDVGHGRESFHLLDISGGGLALLDEKMQLDHETGRIYSHCSLVLPELGEMTVFLEIRNAIKVEMPSGKVCHRLGCKFHAATAFVLDRVQRYILKLERDHSCLMHR